MLRQLLSNPGEDIGMVKPLNMEYKPTTDQEFAPATSTYYYPQPDFNYNHIPAAQPSVIQQPYATSYQPPPMEYAPTSTTDLYSSTYALLSSDTLPPVQPEWSYPVATTEKPIDSSTTYPNNSYSLQPVLPPSQPSTIPQIIYQQPPYQDAVTAVPYPYNYNNYIYNQSYPSTSAATELPLGLERPTSADLRTRRLQSQNQGISGRVAQAAFSESFRKVAIPGGNPGMETDDDATDNERVMCLACKGVYTSRRSLTGHIGRNEKCREIIGRTYLDTLAQTGQSEILPDPSSVEGGISPVCPNCDRFISHYKGNIRRHINQCVQRPVTKSSSGQASPSSVNSVAQHYASMAPVVTKDNPAYHQVMPDCDLDLPGYANDASGTPSGTKKSGGKISNVAVVSTNPYSCSWCKFTTVYKGNMKRHLISVHNCTDEILRKISFDLERLRALAPNRPVTPLAPQPDKIRGCSGRKRKCKAKNGGADNKRAKLLGENEIPPAAVSDVVASFALHSGHYPSDEVLPISSHDSGISSGSSIDESNL